MIRSHVTYKWKTEEDESRRLKYRILRDGNRDILRDEVPKYYATTKFDIICLILIITKLLNERMGLVEISSA